MEACHGTYPRVRFLGYLADVTTVLVMNKENTMSEDLREVENEDFLTELRVSKVAIVYKHSNRCGISWSAKREVDRFLEGAPGVPVYLIDVVQNRALSLKAAEVLGVKHESPQAILLRSGEVKEHASHGRITAKLLNSWVNPSA